MYLSKISINVIRIGLAEHWGLANILSLDQRLERDLFWKQISEIYSPEYWENFDGDLIASFSILNETIPDTGEILF